MAFLYQLTSGWSAGACSKGSSFIWFLIRRFGFHWDYLCSFGQTHTHTHCAVQFKPMIVFQHPATATATYTPQISSLRKTINTRSPSAPLTLDNGVMGRPIYEKINFIYPLIVFAIPFSQPHTATHSPIYPHAKNNLFTTKVLEPTPASNILSSRDLTLCG